MFFSSSDALFVVRRTTYWSRSPNIQLSRRVRHFHCWPNSARQRTTGAARQRRLRPRCRSRL